MEQIIAEYLEAIFVFGLLSAVLLWTARCKGFFSFPHRSTPPLHPVTFPSLCIVFAIYLLMTTAVGPLLVHLLRQIYALLSLGFPPQAWVGWIQMVLLMTIFLLFFLYSKAYAPGLFQSVWKDHGIVDPKPVLSDFFIGIATWFIGYPVVLCVGQIADFLLHILFGFQSFEQVAVRYLKNNLSSPPLLVVALFTILIAAPVIEEFLFRGCLQTFFKRWISPKGAIALSSLCFAFFHYSASQGLGNVSLIASLFTFALFLGFVYERQASLFASIGLHMTFNTVSTVRILFFPE